MGIKAKHEKVATAAGYFWFSKKNAAPRPWVLTNGSERDRKNPFGIKVSQHKAPLGEICYRDDNGI